MAQLPNELKTCVEYLVNEAFRKMRPRLDERGFIRDAFATHERLDGFDSSVEVIILYTPYATAAPAFNVEMRPLERIEKTLPSIEHTVRRIETREEQ